MNSNLKTKLAAIYHKNNIALYHYLIAAKGYINSLGSAKNTVTPEIDFVVTWVDGNDPAWKAEKQRFLQQTHADLFANNVERYRNWDIFRYWFRSVEQYAPWVRKVHLVTCGHFPKWLNMEYPKLNLVTHTQIMDEKYLPTFNSNSIELNLHHIQDLSECFVYFNDDVFLSRPVEPSDFFSNGLPKITAIAEPIHMRKSNSAFDHTLLNATGFINGLCEANACMPAYPEKWFSKVYKSGLKSNFYALSANYFPGFYFSHLEAPFRKSTFEEVWKEAPDLLDSSCYHKFREFNDLMHLIFTMYEAVHGSFSPVESGYFGTGFNRLDQQLPEVRAAFASKKYRSICLNDTELISGKAFEIAKSQLCGILNEQFPEKSSFEL